MTSSKAMIAPMKRESTMTPIDSWRTCGRSGHVTFFISAVTSR
jgi:hypothetical protein